MIIEIPALLHNTEFLYMVYIKECVWIKVNNCSIFVHLQGRNLYQVVLKWNVTQPGKIYIEH